MLSDSEPRRVDLGRAESRGNNSMNPNRGWRKSVAHRRQIPWLIALPRPRMCRLHQAQMIFTDRVLVADGYLTMPSRASRHHAIRWSRCAGVSAAGTAAAQIRSPARKVETLKVFIVARSPRERQPRQPTGNTQSGSCGKLRKVDFALAGGWRVR